MGYFRLRTLKLRDNHIFKKDINFQFSQESDPLSIDSPFITLIIGPNGTGKSSLLRLLIEIFRLAYEKKNNLKISHYPNGKYCLEYYFLDGNYTILNTLGWEDGAMHPPNINDKKGEKGIRFFKDGTEIRPIELPIPESIIALSIMLTDKYPLIKDVATFPFYTYLGIRKDSNSAGTRTYINRTIDNVFQASNRKSFLNDIKDMLKFLDLDKRFSITYSPRYKHLFYSGNITESFFEDFFNDYKKYLARESQPWSVAVYQTIKESEPEIIPKIVKLINHIALNLKYEEDSTRVQYFEFNIFNPEENIKELFEYLPYLNKLDLISYPSIVLSKSGRHYSVEESSSGEYHFISTVIGLLAKIGENSVILIDEPEISLHPNWQMRYIGFLNEVFKRHESAHFIICTHSHFLVSDLRKENSSLISLVKNTSIEALSSFTNTYGWSAEQILLEVFHVSTTRNYFVAEKVGDILELVSQKPRDDVKIGILVRELLDYNIMSLSDEDPLKPVINRLIEKYG